LKYGKIYGAADGRLLLSRVMLAENVLERMRGLLGRPPLADDQGLLISPCSSVHTFGMGYPIDLVFLDRAWQIRRIVAALRPLRMAWAPGAHMTLELAPGVAGALRLEPGQALAWQEAP
jgi:uncharacterized membrane protein (UPF0127 family)